MAHSKLFPHSDDVDGSPAASRSRPAPGRSSEVARVYGHAAPPGGARAAAPRAPALVQRRAAPAAPRRPAATDPSTSSYWVQFAEDLGAVHSIAAAGVSGAGQRLPHLERIQASFGRHDVSGVRAHVGGAAAQASRALGATAYATGNDVAFGQCPDLHTAAHEAAHVVQQRSGAVQLKGGVGRAGDAYEQNADAVADAVAAGRSAEALLDPWAGGGAGGAVQLYGGGASDSGVDRAPDAAPGGKDGGAPLIDGEDDITHGPSNYYDLDERGKDRVNSYLKQVPTILNGILAQQTEALRELRDNLTDYDEPAGATISDALLGILAETALAGALTLVGSGAAAVLGASLAASVAVEAIKKATEESVKVAATTKLGETSGEDPLKRFFTCQIHALQHAGTDAECAFYDKGEQAIKDSESSLRDAQTLVAALDMCRTGAATRRRNRSLDQYFTLTAHLTHGTDDDGDVDFTNMDMRTEQAGVLSAKVYAAGPHYDDIELDQLAIADLDIDFRDHLRQRGTVGDVNIPRNVHGSVELETPYGPTGGNIACGKDARSGARWDNSDEYGIRWLKMIGTGTVYDEPELVDEDLGEDARWEGVRTVFIWLEGQSMKKLG